MCESNVVALAERADTDPATMQARIDAVADRLVDVEAADLRLAAALAGSGECE